MKAFHLVAQYLREQGWRVAWGRLYRAAPLHRENTYFGATAPFRLLRISRRNGHATEICVNQKAIYTMCEEWGLCDPNGLQELNERLDQRLHEM